MVGYRIRSSRIAALVSARATADQIGADSIHGHQSRRTGKRHDYYHRDGEGTRRRVAASRPPLRTSPPRRDQARARCASHSRGSEDPTAGGATRCKVIWNTRRRLIPVDAGSYVILTRRLNSHDVGRGRAVSAALRACPVPVVVRRFPAGSTRCACGRSWPTCCQAAPGCKSSGRSTDVASEDRGRGQVITPDARVG